MTATILAYLDPGSSSMIVQMLLGGLAAAGVALKLYWSRVLRFLRIRKDDPEPAEAPVATGGEAQAEGSLNGGAAGREAVESTKR